MTDADSLNGIGERRLKEIYIDREPTTVPLSYESLKREAESRMDPDVSAFVGGGAGSGKTMRANRSAFEQLDLVPRVLRDVSERDLSVELFDERVPAPVLLAPIGAQAIHHEAGELATARAAASLGIPYVVSTVSSRTLEEIAEVMGEAPRLFQLYWGPDRDLTESFVSRAEAAGYDAIVVTVDMPLTGWRERDAEEAALPPLQGKGLANYFADPNFRARLENPPEEDLQAATEAFLASFTDPSLTWDDLEFLRSVTDLPIVLKGLLHPADAELALEYGIDGIVVSNHGGRQLDSAIGTLDALPGIVDAVDGRIPVVLDGGVRRGTDACKALALGADTVMLGRPYIYGLALAGADGVREVLENFLASFDIAMGLTGHTSPSGLDRTVLRERPRFP